MTEASPVLSAIVLCYRAGESISLVIDPLDEQLHDAGVPYELVLVANYNDRKDDLTPEIVKRWAAEREHVTVLAEAKQGAMGWDMRRGFAAARGDYLLVIDGDAQNPPEDLFEMYRRMKANRADVMKGRRIARFDGPYRRVVSGGFNLLFLVLFRTRGLWDINGKPKGLTRAAYEQLELKSDDWFIDAEIVLEARRKGLRLIEMPVIFRRNDERASFVRVSAIWEFLENMARTRLR